MRKPARRCDPKGGFPARKMGATPSSLDGFFGGKYHLEMDDDWGYPYLSQSPIVFFWIENDEAHG